MEVVRAASLLIAALSTGLMAGVFCLYTNAIMPGLRTTDDRTFVGAFQAIDRAIINPIFLVTFLLPVFSSALAVALHLGADEQSVLGWCIAALVLALFVVVATLRVNVPLNDGIKAAGEPDQIADLGGVRQRFDEGRWTRWNTARAVASTVGFVCLLWALVEFGRNT
jgi:uncharacterized membrane protein